MPVKRSQKKKKYKRKVNWREYNKSLDGGELLFDTDFLSNWRVELREVKKISSIKSMGCYTRKIAVLQQLSDLDK
ncbi:MAG: hypothetical protein WBX01_08715 [Nitrososphaeraceae archaeon]